MRFGSGEDMGRCRERDRAIVERHGFHIAETPCHLRVLVSSDAQHTLIDIITDDLASCASKSGNGTGQRACPTRDVDHRLYGLYSGGTGDLFRPLLE